MLTRSALTLRSHLPRGRRGVCFALATTCLALFGFTLKLTAQIQPQANCAQSEYQPSGIAKDAGYWQAFTLTLPSAYRWERELHPSNIPFVPRFHQQHFFWHAIDQSTNKPLDVGGWVVSDFNRTPASDGFSYACVYGYVQFDPQLGSNADLRFTVAGSAPLESEQVYFNGQGPCTQPNGTVKAGCTGLPQPFGAGAEEPAFIVPRGEIWAAMNTRYAQYLESISNTPTLANARRLDFTNYQLVIRFEKYCLKGAEATCGQITAPNN